MAITRMSGKPIEASISLREAMAELDEVHPVLPRALKVYESIRFGQAQVSQSEIREIIGGLREVKKPQGLTVSS